MNKTVQLPIQKTLKNSTLTEIDSMRSLEQDAVRDLLNLVVLEGQTYPQAKPLSTSEFAAYWLSSDAFVVRKINDKDISAPTEILGAFYLKPNFPGRCSHICNAGFIVQPSWRRQGIGRLMAEAMLEIAPNRGYQAVMFNLVFETNIPSLKLWQSLGFQIIGRIPQAAHLANGQIADALMLYRELAN
jgi:ribosomal protein S18 acetylase RimI-like enzyme